MAENFINRRKELRGTAATWTSNNTVLLEGEWGIETDTGKAKIGDGSTAWNSLSYFGGVTTLQQAIANDPNATSVPEFQGGANIGAGTGAPAIMFLKGSTAGDGLISQIETEMIINAVGDLSMDATGGNVKIGNIEINQGQTLGASEDGYVFTYDNATGIVSFEPASGGSSSEVATYVATNTGTVTLDCDTFDSTYRILTGNTDFQFSNTPASGETFVKTIECISTAGETLTFTTADKVTGTFTNDNTTVNLININFANYPTLGLRVTVNITQ